MARYGMVVDLTRCTGCQTCVVACQMQHNTRPDVRWSSVDFMESGRWPERQRFALPHACMHCDDAPCVAACPAGASIQRKDGIVVVDYETCIGCGVCVDACPFGARQIGAEDRWNFDAAEPAPYEAYGVQRLNVAEKCVFCHDRAEQGETSWCASVCPNGARVFGDLDERDLRLHRGQRRRADSRHGGLLCEGRHRRRPAGTSDRIHRRRKGRRVT